MIEGNERAFERQIPKWITAIIGDDPDRYLHATMNQTLKALKITYESSRVNPAGFAVFQLSIALMEQQEKNRFYEESISHLRQDIIKMRAEIETLKSEGVTMADS